jgi:trans-aconitate methyltransferase
VKRVKTKSLNRKKYIASSRWVGNYYTSNSEWQFQLAAKALSYMRIPPNARVLDIGCGDGRFTKHLSTLFQNAKILGIDPSPSMLATARTNVMPNLSFSQGNAMKLLFKDKFDRIVAFNSLHWVPDSLTALKQVCKALKPGGQALILVAPIQVRYPLHRIINKVARRKRWRVHFGKVPSIFSFHTLPQWAELIEQAGMIPESLRFIDASLDYPNKKAFADSLTGWVPFGTIPENKKSLYVQDIVRAYIDVIPCGPKGQVHYRLDELVIVTSKPLKD